MKKYFNYIYDFYYLIRMKLQYYSNYSKNNKYNITENSNQEKNNYNFSTNDISINIFISILNK